MERKIKKINKKGAVAIVIAAAMAAVLIPTLGTHASAVTSLTHIEEIKAQNSVFNIVEIVPKAGTGSIGYYADGCEPTSSGSTGWKAMAKTRDSAIRSSYVNDLFAQLQTRGLMGDAVTDTSKEDQDHPLTYRGQYTEYMPWDSAIPAGAGTLDLANPESTTISCAFKSVGAGAGRFNLNSTAVLDSAGNYVQNVAYYVYGPASAGTPYYYNLSAAFVQLNFDSADIDTQLGSLASAHAAMYSAVYTDTTNTTVDHYVYEGTLGESGFLLNAEETYFYVDSSKTGAPSTSNNSQGTLYYAVPRTKEPYIEAPAGSQGYFRMQEINYVYVGDGEGGYDFDNTAAAANHMVKYSTVRYTGGYTNNDWLLKNVFDVQDADVAAVKQKMKIQVYSVTPDANNPQTVSNLTGLLKAADLIVVSDGFDISDGSAAGGYSTAGGIDLNTAQTDMLTTAVSKGRALLADGRVGSEPKISNLKTFVAEQSKNLETGFVSGSLYYFLPDADRTALATPNFTKAFVGFSDEQSPYYEVYKEIDYENFLRTTAKRTGDLLPSTVNMANCIRYIINFSGQRVVNNKTSINVLDVEPQTQSSSSGLSLATVKKWLPEDAIADGNITIDTMSSAEFISKIDDINEKYDLVYIGASLNNMSTATDAYKNTTTVYNDTAMNGLIYSNIGDKYISGMNLTGLLDRDYSAQTFDNNGATYNMINANDTTKTFRFSGNDITAAKSTELRNFADSGLPIVVSDGLLTEGQAAVPDYTMSVSLSGVYNSNGSVTLTAAAATQADGDITYNFFGPNGSIGYPQVTSGKTVTFTFYPSDYGYSAGDYYCTATLQTKTAASNTVTVGNTYTAVQSDEDNQTCSPTGIGITYNNYKTMQVTVPSYYVTGYTLQWQSSSDGQKWADIVGKNQNSINYGNYKQKYLRCAVTTSDGSQTYHSAGYWIKNNGSVGRSTDSDNYTFTPVVTVTPGSAGATLTASPSVVFPGGNYSYEWRDYYNNYWQGSTLTRKSGTYYCTISFTSDSDYPDGYSYDYTVSSGWAVTKNSGGTTVKIPGKAATDAVVDTDRVDNASTLYTTLRDILPKVNVMSQKEAETQQETLLKYLNLSKPSIVFENENGAEAKPAEYTGIGDIGKNLTADRTLTYKFSISNPTDTTPLTTRYSCKLYIDLNADGRYKPNEEITDLLITDADGKVVSENALEGGKVYTLKRSLPSNYNGSIPWRLMVTKAGSAQIHASQIGYTYIKPAKATPIKVLQVRSSALDLSTDPTYQDLCGKVKSVYDISIKCITTGDLNSFKANITKYDSKANINDYLNGYDMLIMGFGDMYKELNKASADAVVNYISSGKAILFTHDTTSFTNVPFNYTTTSSGSVEYKWGYYFNTILRDPVGLDRYGVTNAAYGITRYQKAKTASGPVAAGYPEASRAKTVTDLLKSGYSVAFEPKSAIYDEQGNLSGYDVVPETQGFTKYELVRYTSNTAQKNPTSTGSYATGGGNNLTNSVSQVNKGQITSFPFNINTKAFSTETSAPDMLSVATTHDQYYQLNMNSDDIVVWYCLAGGVFNQSKNDGVNAYYIYNRGNVTYSGAGHQTSADDIKGHQQEAELFINTMIAAYRAGAVNPTVGFYTANNAARTSQLLPVEFGTGAVGTSAEDTRVYFRITDPNLVTNKTMSVSFYYKAGNNTSLVSDKKADLESGTVQPTDEGIGFTAIPDSAVPVYSASTDEKVSALRSDTLYYIVLPSSLAAIDDSNITLLVKVTTTIGSDQYIGVSPLLLQKMGYLSLR